MDAYFAEKVGVKEGFLGDLTGGAESARIKMDKSYRVALVITLDSALVDLDVQLRQHDAATLGNSKNLIVPTKAFVKLAGETVFKEKTLVDGKLADATLNGSAGTVILEVLAEELDRDGGFSHISALFTQGAVARVACVNYHAHAMKHLPAYAQEL